MLTYPLITIGSYGDVAAIMLPQKVGKKFGKEEITIDEENMFQLASFLLLGVTNPGHEGQNIFVNHSLL